MYSIPNFEPVHCSMSGSNCCFLTCVQVSQEAGKVVWYSHLFKNFPQFVVIHTVKCMHGPQDNLAQKHVLSSLPQGPLPLSLSCPHSKIWLCVLTDTKQPGLRTAEFFVAGISRFQPLKRAEGNSLLSSAVPSCGS